MLSGGGRRGQIAGAVAWLAVLCTTTSCNPKPFERDELRLECVPQPTPICGNPCLSNPGICGAGCMGCSVGADWCSDGTVYHCADTCIEIVEVCPDTNACIASGCARSSSDCDAIRAAYEQTIKPVANGSVVAVVREGTDSLAPGEYGPNCPGDCNVVAGDCTAGLDTCWLVGHRSAETDRLAALYERMGCPALSACNCPPLKSTLVCTTVQTSDPTLPFNACVVEGRR